MDEFCDLFRLITWIVYVGICNSYSFNLYFYHEFIIFNF
jgi:hypothetical protein